ncbi:MAG: putative manganese transporter [Candidatus Cryptobacteroides sp.]
MWDLLLEVLKTTVLVTGLVVIMMMLIESVNVENSGRVFGRLKRNSFAQVLISALLGVMPGCMGGFAVVSMYTHRLLGFGALLAMMVATAGDEAFLMLAMFPDKALILMGILLAVAVVAGLVADRFSKTQIPTRLEDSFEIHDEDSRHEHPDHGHGRHISVKLQRIILLAAVVLFLAALLTGYLEDGEHVESTGFNFLSEEWMYWLFGCLSVIVIFALLFSSDHFVEEHLWEHIICRHLPSIVAWTGGMLLAVGLLFRFIDLSAWISENTFLMILLAILVGLVPQSGPHMVFVTLFASGVIPFPVLLANSLVQDGHASLPLLADSKKSFVKAKLVKVLIALVLSSLFLLFG